MFLSTPALAALPPSLQRVQEMIEILRDPAIISKLAEPLDRIEALEGGSYRLSTRRCSMDVAVRRASPAVPMAGMGAISLAPGPVLCGQAREGR